MGAPLPLAEARLRGHRADQRPRLRRQPLPGRPGRLGAASASCWPRRTRWPATPTRTRSRGTPPTVPSTGPRACGALGNTGYQQARFNVASMARRRAEVTDRVDRRGAGAGLRVERRPGGQRRGGRAAPPAGTSTPATGSGSTPRRPSGRRSSATSPSGLPEWRAAGETSRAEAARRCGEDWAIQGGDGGAGRSGSRTGGTRTSPARASTATWPAGSDAYGP